MALETKMGLKINIPLATSSKLMCSCACPVDEILPNTSICSVCMGIPGAVPQLNEGALLLALLAAISLECKVDSELILEKEMCGNLESPKGYVYTQITRPLGVRGNISVGANRKIAIKNVILTEKKCRNTEHLYHGIPDYNDCGVPLLTVESEQVLKGVEELIAYVKSLFSVLSYLGITDIKPELDAFEISLRTRVDGGYAKSYGTDISAFVNLSGLKEIAEFEDGRQQGMVIFGLPVDREFFVWDKIKKSAVPYRLNESRENYLFDGEFPPVMIQDDYLRIVMSLVRELPAERKKRYVEQEHIDKKDADVICRERAYVELFEETVRLCGFSYETAHWIAAELDPILHEFGIPPRALDISAEKFAGLMILKCNFLIDDDAGREILRQILIHGVDPYEYSVEHGLSLIIDHTTLELACRLTLYRHADLFAEFIKGDLTAFEELINLALEELRNKADVNAVRLIMEQEATPQMLEMVEKYPAKSDISAFDMKSSLDVSRLIEITDVIDKDNNEQNEKLPLRAYGRDLTQNEIENIVDSIVDRTLKEAGNPKFLTSEGTYEETPRFAQNIDAIITEMVGTAPGDVTKSELFADYYAKKNQKLTEQQEEEEKEASDEETIEEINDAGNEQQDEPEQEKPAAEEKEEKPLTEEDEFNLLISELENEINSNSNDGKVN